MSDKIQKTIEIGQQFVAVLDLETLGHAKAHDVERAKITATLAQTVHDALVDYAVRMGQVVLVA